MIRDILMCERQVQHPTFWMFSTIVLLVGIAVFFYQLDKREMLIISEHQYAVEIYSYGLDGYMEGYKSCRKRQSQERSL